MVPVFMANKKVGHLNSNGKTGIFNLSLPNQQETTTGYTTKDGVIKSLLISNLLLALLEESGNQPLINQPHPHVSGHNGQ